MKYISVLIMILAICLALAPAVQAEEVWGDTMHWEFDDQTGILTISGSGETQVGGSNCPWLDHREKIKKVVIQEGVTGIGNKGFSHLVNLQEVVMPQSVKSIGDYAFYNCRSLTGVDLTYVTSLGEYAFYDCGLTSVTIPAGITTIGRSTFHNCRNLSTLILHDGITEIGYSAFQSCYALTSLRMPSSLKTIDAYAFAHCANLKEIQLNEGLEILGRGAFSYCSGLETITFPDSVQEVSQDCFIHCTALRSIHFGAKLSKFAPEALRDCNSLTTFTISNNNPYMTVHQNGLYSLEPRELVAIAPSFNGEHVIPDGTVSIRFAACYGAKLTSVTIPGSVKTISQQAFTDCAGLRTVILKEGIEVIGPEAFSRSGVTEITFPSTIKKIGQLAFVWCQNLKKITFTGLPPETESSFAETSATVYYPGYMGEWKNAQMMHNEYYLTYIPDCMGQHDLRWDVIKAPTCTAPGLSSEKWCVVCRQNVEPSTEIPATGHSYGTWIQVNPPTTDKEGLAQRTCSACGETEHKSLSKLPPTPVPPTENTQPPVTEPPVTEPNQTTPSEPPITEPTVAERTEPTVSEPPAQTTPVPSEDPAPFSWIPVVSIAVVSILIGLTVAFLIFTLKKLKNK